MKPVQQKGFTLIELMVVIVIVAILAGIAYPNYTQYVLRTRRADAQSALLQLQGQEEKYFTQCGQYTATIVGGTISGCSGLGYANSNSPDANYTLSVALNAGNASYTATATPAAGKPQVNDFDCLNLTLTSAGVKSQSGLNVQNRCWQK